MGGGGRGSERASRPDMAPPSFEKVKQHKTLRRVVNFYHRAQTPPRIRHCFRRPHRRKPISDDRRGLWNGDTKNPSFRKSGIMLKIVAICIKFDATNGLADAKRRYSTRRPHACARHSHRWPLIG